MKPWSRLLVVLTFVGVLSWSLGGQADLAPGPIPEVPPEEVPVDDVGPEVGGCARFTAVGGGFGLLLLLGAGVAATIRRRPKTAA